VNSIADELAKKQKEISVSEFFERNRQILGFDSQVKSLIMGVKEAVDNSLDACEEAMILPEIYVRIEKVEANEYKVTVEDNGPGIIKKAIPNVFGRLLYGSRFHAVRQSRGQQGIGISATVMFGQITTGKPATVRSKVGNEDTAWELDIMVNTKKNMPDVFKENPVIWDGKEHGTRIEFYMNGRYMTGKQSVMEYLKQTAIVNPHAKISFVDPEGRRTTFERATDLLPPAVKEIKPHPEGIELGTLMNMANETKSKTLSKFLQSDFCRISDRLAKDISVKAGMDEDRSNIRSWDPDKNKNGLKLEDYKRLLTAIGAVKIMAKHDGEATLRVQSITAEVPAAVLPDWLGRRPPVAADRAGICRECGQPMARRSLAVATDVPLLTCGACHTVARDTPSSRAIACPEVNCAWPRRRSTANACAWMAGAAPRLSSIG